MNPTILVATGAGILGFLWMILLAGIIIEVFSGEEDGITHLFFFLLLTGVVLMLAGGVWSSIQPKSTMPPALRESFERGYDPTNEAPTKGGQ